MGGVFVLVAAWLSFLVCCLLVGLFVLSVSVGCLAAAAGLLDGRLGASGATRLEAWLVGWLDGWVWMLDGWLVGWLYGCVAVNCFLCGVVVMGWLVAVGGWVVEWFGMHVCNQSFSKILDCRILHKL